MPKNVEVISTHNLSLYRIKNIRFVILFKVIFISFSIRNA